MTDDIKYLRVLKEGLSLKEIFSEEFLNKLKDNFEDFEILPVGVAFAIQKDNVTEDMIQLNYRTDDEMDNNIIMIDAQNNHENITRILNSFK